MLNSLTGLRFVAAFYVVLFHSGAHYAAAIGLPMPIQRFLANGYLGVPFFFILSGFILQLTYRGRVRPGATLRHYAIARIARVYPVYIIALLLSFIAMPSAAGSQWPQFLLVQAWLPSGLVPMANTNMAAWSLSVELTFYLAFPLLALLVAKWRGSILGAILLLCALFLISTDSASLTRSEDSSVAGFAMVPLPLLRLPEFVLGVILGELHLRGHGRRLPVPLSAVLGVILAMLCTFEGVRISGWVALVSAVLVYVAAGTDRGWAWKILNSRTMTFLGGASYSLYLIHVPLIVTLREALPHALRLILQMPLLLMSSCVLFYFFEEPLRRFFRRLASRGETKASCP